MTTLPTPLPLRLNVVLVGHFEFSVVVDCSTPIATLFHIVRSLLQQARTPTDVAICLAKLNGQWLRIKTPACDAIHRGNECIARRDCDFATQLDPIKTADDYWRCAHGR